MAVDVVARKAMRRLEVFSENMHIFWDGSPNTLSEFDITTKETKNINCYESIEKNKIIVQI